jgi:uncharacterized membrane protein
VRRLRESTSKTRPAGRSGRYRNPLSDFRGPQLLTGVLVGKNRLEAFSDGVLAIIITIMVLEMKVPQRGTLDSLKPVIPVFMSYVLSFLYIGIYWNNHHHMLHTCNHITGSMLWANLNLLFWLSLFPFATGWMGENHFEPMPTLLYGAVLLMAAMAYFILQSVIISVQGPDSLLRKAVGSDWKGKLSPVLYVLGIVATSWAPAVSQGIYVLVALLWLVPDRRIERVLHAAKS